MRSTPSSSSGPTSAGVLSIAPSSASDHAATDNHSAAASYMDHALSEVQSTARSEARSTAPSRRMSALSVRSALTSHSTAGSILQNSLKRKIFDKHNRSFHGSIWNFYKLLGKFSYERHELEAFKESYQACLSPDNIFDLNMTLINFIETISPLLSGNAKDNGALLMICLNHLVRPPNVERAALAEIFILLIKEKPFVANKRGAEKSINLEDLKRLAKLVTGSPVPAVWLQLLTLLHLNQIHLTVDELENFKNIPQLDMETLQRLILVCPMTELKKVIAAVLSSGSHIPEILEIARMLMNENNASVIETIHKLALLAQSQRIGAAQGLTQEIEQINRTLGASVTQQQPQFPSKEVFVGIHEHYTEIKSGHTFKRDSEPMKIVSAECSKELFTLAEFISCMSTLCSYTNSRTSKTTTMVVDQHLKTQHPFWYHFFHCASYLQLPHNMLYSIIETSMHEGNLHELAISVYRVSTFLMQFGSSEEMPQKFCQIFPLHCELISDGKHAATFSSLLKLYRTRQFGRALLEFINRCTNLSVLINILQLFSLNNITLNEVDIISLRRFLPHADEAPTGIFNQLQTVIYLHQGDKVSDVIFDIISLGPRQRETFFQNYFHTINSEPTSSTTFSQCFCYAVQNLPVPRALEFDATSVADNISVCGSERGDAEDGLSMFAEDDLLDEPPPTVEPRTLTTGQDKFFKAMKKEFELRKISVSDAILTKLCADGSLYQLYVNFNDEQKAKFIADLGLVCLEANRHDVMDFLSLNKLDSGKALQSLLTVIENFISNSIIVDVGPERTADAAADDYSFSPIRPVKPTGVQEIIDSINTACTGEYVDLDTTSHLVEMFSAYSNSTRDQVDLRTATATLQTHAKQLAQLRSERTKKNEELTAELALVRRKAALNAHAEQSETEEPSDLISGVLTTRKAIAELSSQISLAEGEVRKSQQNHTKAYIHSIKSNAARPVAAVTQILGQLRNSLPLAELQANFSHLCLRLEHLAEHLASESELLASEQGLQALATANTEVHRARQALTQYKSCDKELRSALQTMQVALTGGDPANGNLNLDIMVSIANLSAVQDGMALSDLVEILRRLKAAGVSLHAFSDIFIKPYHHAAFRAFIEEFLDQINVQISEVSLPDLSKIWTTLQEGPRFNPLVKLMKSYNGWLSTNVAVNAVIFASNNLNDFIVHMQKMLLNEEFIQHELNSVTMAEPFLMFARHAHHIRRFDSIFTAIINGNPNLMSQFLNSNIISKLSSLFEKYTNFCAYLNLLITTRDPHDNPLTYLIEIAETFLIKNISLVRTIHDLKARDGDALNIRLIRDWLGRFNPANYRDGHQANLEMRDAARQIEQPGESSTPVAANTDHRYTEMNRFSESITKLSTSEALTAIYNSNAGSASLSEEQKIQLALFNMVMNNTSVSLTSGLGAQGFFVALSARDSMPSGVIDGRLYSILSNGTQHISTIKRELTELLGRYSELQQIPCLNLPVIQCDSSELVRELRIIALPQFSAQLTPEVSQQIEAYNDCYQQCLTLLGSVAPAEERTGLDRTAALFSRRRSLSPDDRASASNGASSSARWSRHA